MGTSHSNHCPVSQKNVVLPRHLLHFVGSVLAIGSAISSSSFTRFCHSSPAINSSPEQRRMYYGGVFIFRIQIRIFLLVSLYHCILFIFFFIFTTFCTILDPERESKKECVICKLKVAINEGFQLLPIYISFLV